MRALPASEVEEWRVFCEFEPLPDPYWIGAQICQVTANTNKIKGKAYKVDDFIPRAREKRRQTPEEMLSVLRGVKGKEE